MNIHARSRLDGAGGSQGPEGRLNLWRRVPELKTAIEPGSRASLLLAIENLVVDVPRSKSGSRSVVNLKPSRPQRLDISRGRPVTQRYETTTPFEVG